MLRRRTPIRLLAACLLAGALMACGGGDEELTVYSGRSEELVGPLLERFNAETGVDVAVRYGDTAELALLLAEEGEDTPADVFYSQSPGATGYLAEADLLAALEPDALSRVVDYFNSPNNLWVSVTGRQRVLVYNSELVEEADLPASVLDVNDPEYAGRVAVAPENGSFQDFVTALRQAQGDDGARAWLTGLADAGAPTYANNNAIVEAVSRGEVEMGLVNHYYNYRFLEENPESPTRNHVFPDGDTGSIIIDSTVSVTAGAADNADADALVAFLLSDESQRYFADETKEYPLAEGVGPSDDIPPLELEGAAPVYQADELGGGLTDTIDLIRESGLGV